MFRNLNPGSIRGIRDLRLSQEKLYDLAKATSFEGIDLNIREMKRKEENHILEEVKNPGFWRDLKLGGWRLPIKWREDTDDLTFQSGLKDLRHLASIAHKFSCDRVYTWIFPFSDKFHFKDNVEWHVKRLQPVVEILKKEGCRLGLEYVGTKTMREGHKYEFIHNLKGLLDLVDKIGTSNVGLLLDSWHWYTSHETLSDLKQLDSRQIVYVHISDAPAGVSMENLIDDERRLPGETKVINLRGFVRCLFEIAYDGPITPECFNRRLRCLSNFSAAREAGKALLDLWNSSLN